MAPDTNTEGKIMEAAREVFIQKGMAAARMQEIADRAGINKALLHYYYRSKEKLFMAVFRFAFQTFIPKIEKMMAKELDFESRIRVFVENYINILIKHPFIPLFIMQEINRNPDALYKVVTDSGIDPTAFFTMVQKEIAAGRIRKTDPRNIIINMLSLCIFPIAAKPMLQRILFENNGKAYKKFLMERVDEITRVILISVKAENEQ